jgi:hypothetical protein
MNRPVLPLVFGVAVILASATECRAQTAPQTAGDRQAQMDDSPLNRSVSAVARVFDEMIAKAKAADAPVRISRPEVQLIEFREAVPRFLDAILPFESAASSGGDYRKHAKVIQAQTDVFLRYAKWMGSSAQRPNTSELKKLKPQMRIGEMFLSLSQMVSDLRQVLEDDKSPTTSISHMGILETFEVESYRLNWLSSHLP